jgi:hypothetical protein
MFLPYKDTATFYKVASDEYGRKKLVTEYEDVPVIFLQGIKVIQSGGKETLDADAVCYPDPENDFVVSNYNRLEGMFIKAPLYGVDNDDAWYRVESATVNRDHLLTNTIDNILLILKKSAKLLNVS